MMLRCGGRRIHNNLLRLLLFVKRIVLHMFAPVNCRQTWSALPECQLELTSSLCRKLWMSTTPCRIFEYDFIIKIFLKMINFEWKPPFATSSGLGNLRKSWDLSSLNTKHSIGLLLQHRPWPSSTFNSLYLRNAIVFTILFNCANRHNTIEDTRHDTNKSHPWYQRCHLCLRIYRLDMCWFWCRYNAVRAPLGASNLVSTWVAGASGRRIIIFLAIYSCCWSVRAKFFISTHCNVAVLKFGYKN